MSTKSIRRALEMMRTDPMSQDFADRPEFLAALEEVRAIERAAKFMTSVDVLREPRAVARHAETLESIARDAP